MSYSSVDTLWILMAAVLVFFMQPGFAMLEAGLTRGKNAGNIVMKNFMNFSLGTLAFWIVGFSLLFGRDIGGFIGMPDFFAQHMDLMAGTPYPDPVCSSIPSSGTGPGAAAGWQAWASMTSPALLSSA